MVLPDSHRVSRVPWYSGTRLRRRHTFRVLGFHPLWPVVPDCSTRRTFCNSSIRQQPDHIGPHNPPYATPVSLARTEFRLIRVRSPLLTESHLLSFPPGTEMVHFPGLTSPPYEFGWRSRGLPSRGCPIRRSSGQSLFAAHRSLSQLTTSFIAGLRQGIHRTPLVA